MKAVSVLLLAAAALLPAQRDEIFDDLDRMSKELANITGLSLKHSVERDFLNRSKLKAYLEDKIKESVKPEEIRAEELTLKKFGFIPQDFDLKQTTIDLLAEQAAAFYDFHKKKLFILESSSDAMQRMALVHELAHALADQHFHLEKFLKKADTDDATMARTAVMEGQAQWLMLEYVARQARQSLADSQGAYEMLSGAADVASGQFPELDKSPLYIKETLLFPYTAGMRFQQQVYLKSGKAGFAQVFRNPPATTRQIIHPDVYFSKEKPASLPLPSFKEKGFKTLSEGTIGELDHSILIRQFATRKEADEIAPEWRGGRYQLLENPDAKRSVLRYTVEFNTEDSARRYFAIYRDRVLTGKWKKLDLSKTDDTHAEGQGDDGRFVLLRQGRRVNSLEGLR